MEVSGPTAEFEALLTRPEREVPLDRTALLVAAHAYPGLDVDSELERLDDVAAGCHAPTLDALVAYLYIDERFRGNRRQYHDPRNSFLNDVLDRRLGIPITLAIVAIEVGRRLGVPIAGVGMPGHFLLRDRVDPSVFVDPWNGRFLDAAGCEATYRSVLGTDAEFDPSFLEPVGKWAIIARLLANLKSIYLARSDRDALAWVLRLRCLVPNVPVSERGELASALAANGRFLDAADELDELAGKVDDANAAEHRRAAVRLRAQLN